MSEKKIGIHSVYFNLGRWHEKDNLEVIFKNEYSSKLKKIDNQNKFCQFLTYEPYFFITLIFFPHFTI